MKTLLETEAYEAECEAQKYLTSALDDKEQGIETFNKLKSDLGAPINSYPTWHPIVSLAERRYGLKTFHHSPTYKKADHTRMFTKGFVTCPYSKYDADQIVSNVNKVDGLTAYHLEQPLYHDSTHPVVVEVLDLPLEADGTIRSRDAIRLCAQDLIDNAKHAEVAETWWNIRRSLLGEPCDLDSSPLVNSHSGKQMRKILDTLNASGIYGPIREESLDMIPHFEQLAICERIVLAAIKEYEQIGLDKAFEFEMRGETCEAIVTGEFDCNEQLTVSVKIGDHDMRLTALYYVEDRTYELCTLTGKQLIAEKFI